MVVWDHYLTLGWLFFNGVLCMKFYLNLFSVETWEAFNRHGADVSGFSKYQRTQASKIEVDSVFLCYLVKLSRWVGALRITGESYDDNTPIFRQEDDPFIVRFPVSPLVKLSPENGIPIQIDDVWHRLEWTRDIIPGNIGWGAHFQRSLRLMPEGDGQFLLDMLQKQSTAPIEYPLTRRDRRILSATNTVRTERGDVEVEIPDEDDEPVIATEESEQPRESLIVQASLAKIGAAMGMEVWLPRSDRTKLETYLDLTVTASLIDEITLPFKNAVIRTIEQIDVLWINEGAIVRAFEVEHTTAVHSGLLRMADLLIMVPNLDVKFHIVADDQRRGKVFKELKRPVFQMMEGQLSRK